MVASHTVVPLGTAKWLGKRHPHQKPCRLGKGHTLLMSPTQGQAYIIGGHFLSSHFETPKGVSVWLATFVRCLWHPLCKQPNCIFSLLTVPCMLPNDILFANCPSLTPSRLRLCLDEPAVISNLFPKGHCPWLISRCAGGGRTPEA